MTAAQLVGVERRLDGDDDAVATSAFVPAMESAKEEPVPTKEEKEAVQEEKAAAPAPSEDQQQPKGLISLSRIIHTVNKR